MDSCARQAEGSCKGPPIIGTTEQPNCATLSCWEGKDERSGLQGPKV